MTLGIKAVGISVIVLPDQIKTETESGIITMTDTEAEREQMAQTHGVVVDIGPIAWHDEVDKDGNVIPRCKVGDKVVMMAYAGMIRKGPDGTSYRLIRDTDVIGVINE